MTKTKMWFLPLMALALVGSALAQTAEAPKFYKLEFTLKELEGGKTINSRSYSTLMPVQTPGSNTPGSSIRAGGRVPFVTGTNPNQFQFIDEGVNLDLRELREAAGDVSFYVAADMSTVVHEGAPTSQPIIRQNKWQGSVLVPVKKPTVLFASDDLSTKRQLQLEVTAIPITK